MGSLKTRRISVLESRARNLQLKDNATRNLIKDIGSGERVELFSLEPNFSTQSLNPYTAAGALSTAAISAVGARDKFAITNGDSTSQLKFNNQFSSNDYEWVLRIKVDVLGAAPLIGMVIQDVPSGTYSNFTQSPHTMYANLVSGAVTATGLTDSENVVSTNNALGTVNAGDIIEFRFKHVFLQYKEIIIENMGLGAGVTWRKATLAGRSKGSDPMSSHFTPSLILADGTFTVLDFKMYSLIPRQPKIMIVGDSWGSGNSLNPGESIREYLRAKTPFNIASNAGGSCVLAGMQACIHEVFKQEPEYLLMVQVLDNIYFGYSDPLHANHATFIAAIQKYVNTIKAKGIKPMFCKFNGIRILDSTGLKSSQWNAVVDTYFPGEIVIDLTEKRAIGTYGWDYEYTNFHPNAKSNEFIADKTVSKLKELKEM